MKKGLNRRQFLLGTSSMCAAAMSPGLLGKRQGLFSKKRWNKDFVHLHVHSEYSLLYSTIRIDNLLKAAKQYGMTAVALTDSANMFGAMEFYRMANEQGVKPIIGCEVCVSAEPDREQGLSFRHLLLLAESNEGYRNLCRLVTAAHLESTNDETVINKQLLQEHNTGLIALSGCLKGEIPQLILQDKMKTALRAAGEYGEVFDDGRFFLELSDNGLPGQKKINKALLGISKRLSIPVVATGNCHYLDKKEAFAHEVLMCIREGTTIHSSNRPHYGTDGLCFHSPEEMNRLFSHVPEALDNTLLIAERCNVGIEFGKNRIPECLPDNVEKGWDFEDIVTSGLANRIFCGGPSFQTNSGKKWLLRDYFVPLKQEIEIIQKKGWESYFLIVADYVNYARKNSIPVGTGRGAVCGSLTAYGLGITDIDPVENGLIFERFLNPERDNPPDIDLDFCMEGRDRVADYIYRKYGDDRVSQIATFAKLSGRGAVYEVGRALDMPKSKVGSIARLVPLGSEVGCAVQDVPHLKKFMDKDHRVKKLLETAQTLEGLKCRRSSHSCGLVIADKPLVNYLPLCKLSDGSHATQYTMYDIDCLGFVKFDLLGLRDLTAIQKTIARTPSENRPDLRRLALDDPKTLGCFASAETDGVFQFQSEGVKELLKESRPETLRDLAAILCLYRPGPFESGMVDDYIAAGQVKRPMSVKQSMIREILSETRGVLIYQEQVMEIARRVAGFSYADADLLRRALGKKKVSEIRFWKKRFIAGARLNAISTRYAKEIWGQLTSNSEYCFMKAHSISYAHIAYQAAYLKAHFPTEFEKARRKT